MKNFVIITQESAYPQMGPLYLSDALQKVGIKTHLFPVRGSADSLDELIEHVDPIAVGCSVMTSPDIVGFAEHSMHIQEKYNRPGKNGNLPIPVIWGGMHATIVADQTAKEDFIDVVVSGEAEVTLPLMLLKMIGDDRVRHISDDQVYLTGSTQKLRRVRTPFRLDDFSPDWSLVNLKDYIFPEKHSIHSQTALGRGDTKQNIFYYLLSSRGCTFKCNFCWEVARTASLKNEMKVLDTEDDYSWRSHSLQWVESELERITSALSEKGVKVDGVGLWDDMPLGKERPEHIARIRSFFEIMRDKNYGYLLEARASQLIKKTDKWNGSSEREADLYKFLRETGCLQVFVGAESASDETLKMIQKGTSVAQYRRLVELSRDIGLPIRYSLIVGFPGETDKSVNATLDFAEEMQREPFISISGPKLATPYPGTGLFASAQQRGMKVPKTTVEWARINRYSDYRGVFPWLTQDLSESTLNRIDAFFNGIETDRRRQAKEDKIYELVRAH